MVGIYKYFVAYYANIKKDKATALAYCDSVLVLDPADTEAAKNKEVIQAMNMNAPAPKQQPKSGGASKPSADKGTKPKSPDTKK